MPRRPIEGIERGGEGRATLPQLPYPQNKAYKETLKGRLDTG